MLIVIRAATVVTSDAGRTVHHDASIVGDADRLLPPVSGVADTSR